MRYTPIAALIAVPALSLADPAEDTVKARQGYYSLLGANMGVFASMAKGERDYDAAAAQVAADNIVLLTGYDIQHLFAPGTSSADVKGARALPAIWEEFPGVQAKVEDLTKAAMAMQEVAGMGKGEMAGAMGTLGGACKSCHKTFRAD